MLRLLDNCKDAEVIRSRDDDVLSKLDMLVDVGSVYNPETLRFDHHQRGFNETFSPKHTIKLSSAGLVYKHFGKEIISKITVLEDPELIDLVYNKVYNSFIEGIDAIDNGVPQYPADIEPAYVNNTGIGSRVGRLNPDWNETFTNEELLERFHKASAITGEEFIAAVQDVVKSWLPSRQICYEAFRARFQPNDVDSEPTGEYILLDSFCPWKDHFFTAQADEDATAADMEAEQSLRNVKYIVYDGQGQWRFLAVPIHKTSFASRLPFPESWRGLRDADLEAVCGVPGATFVHHAGFTGGHKTKEGVIAMIKKSLEAAKQ
jgi:uncharacterized UPF0160 family protein